MTRRHDDETDDTDPVAEIDDGDRSDSAPEQQAAAREALSTVLRVREPAAAAELAARAAADYDRAGPAFARDAARLRAR